MLVVLPKKGADPLEQVEKLLSRPLYNKVREQYGSIAALLARYVLGSVCADVSLAVPPIYPPWAYLTLRALCSLCSQPLLLLVQDRGD